MLSAFCMTREIAHQKSFEKALYAIEGNFPPGKMPGNPDYTDKYYNMSQGDGDARGPWNKENGWEYISDREQQMAVDGGDGMAEVSLSSAEAKALKATAARTQTNPTANPTTGADLGAKPGAGATKRTGNRALVYTARVQSPNEPPATAQFELRIGPDTASEGLPARLATTVRPSKARSMDPTTRANSPTTRSVTREGAVGRVSVQSPLGRSRLP